MTRRWYFFLTSYFQVQVYWSESPKAKFVKQGEVDQVNHHSGLTENNCSGDVNNHSNPKHHWNLFQVSFTAKLTVSDKKVKWSFQDQVRIIRVGGNSIRHVTLPGVLGRREVLDGAVQWHLHPHHQPARGLWHRTIQVILVLVLY